MKQVDYIIVGQGLAGTCTALSLLREKQTVVVVASTDKKASSEVAAGLFNPITGKKMVLTWNAKELFPYLLEFYMQAEEELKIKVLYPKKIYRPFSDMQAQNDFWARSTAESAVFGAAEPDNDAYTPYINNPFGGISTNFSGYLDVKTFIQAVQNKLKDSGAFLNETLAYDDLIFEKEFVQYKDVRAKKIIFAEGYHNRENPYFKWVPVQGMKGDVLTLDIEDYPLQDVVNKHFFIIPLPEGSFRMGSSYIRQFEDDLPTAAGLKEITEGANTILKKPFVVTSQLAGIRPVVPDHRPIIGPHPENPLAVIINGLGTKGVSLSPFAARELVKFLLKGQEIDKSVSVNRFNYLYFIQKKN
jgi:glycine/D-amino acid oxidase-like deaminating enzyme